MDEKHVPLLGEPAARDLGARIEARRGDRPFMARLRRLLDENASALQRLAGSETRAAERRYLREHQEEDVAPAARVQMVPLCDCTGEQLERGEHCDSPDCPNRPA